MECPLAPFPIKYLGIPRYSGSPQARHCSPWLMGSLIVSPLGERP